MIEIAAAILFALLVWWAGTGAILVAVRLPRRMLAALMAASMPVLAASVLLFDWAAEEPGLTGVFLGFTAAIAIWGWHEFTFLTGAVTGPRPRPCPEGAGEWRRFTSAVAALAWHEIGLAVTALALVALTWFDQNQFGLWTFLILFFARISAKLNLFLGVPNFSAELIPDALGHLRSYFRTRAMNLLFPISITGLMLALGCWIERAYAADTIADLAGFTLLAMLTALALIEHWLLVLPLRDAALWQWLLPKADAESSSEPTTDRV